MCKQSLWTKARSKESVAASGFPYSSFMVCQPQTAGTKQTGQSDALGQLIWQMDRVTFQSAYASQCQQPVITYATVSWVWFRGKVSSRNQKEYI